jgi:hypothetical protein
MEMELKVECYSGYRADERPLRFKFLRGDDPREFKVSEILDRWYGLGYECFKVRADDGNDYILRHSLDDDDWHLGSFRQNREQGGQGLSDKRKAEG